MHPSTQQLEEARQQVSFPFKELQKYIYTPEMLYQFLQNQSKLDNLPEYKNSPNYHNLNRKDKILTGPKKLEHLRNMLDLTNIDNWFTPLIHSQGIGFASTSFGMTVQAIRILGTEEQIKRWDSDFLSTNIIAAYAQTEIGCGSDVQGLRTTATFDARTDEIIINSPCIESIKFWPGELGLLSNWALVYARLITNNNDLGIHPFMVPIRDMDNHQVLPGIIVGDIGPKMGYDPKDNGYLAFQQVRIPRNNMLQKYLRLNRDGTLTKLGDEKISYSSMMLIRKLLIYIHPRIAAQALTIAIRYSFVRSQFKNDLQIENQVIDYQSQQEKLFPQLAKLYAVIFGGLWLKQLVENNFQRVQNRDFSQLQLCHALLSGAKANYTYFVSDCIEWCRLSCGGHGYAHYSGLPGMFFETVPNITLEGENKVMYLQLARYLLKQLKQAYEDPSKIPEQFNFLKNTDENLSNVIVSQNESELSQLNVLLQFFQQNVTAALMNCVVILQNLTSQKISNKEAWDYHTNDHLINAASAYMEYFNLKIFIETIQNVSEENIRASLTSLAQLYGIHTILTKCQFLIDENLISPQQLKILRVAKDKLLLVIKKDAIGFVEAFGYSDNSLKTLIGTHDGRVYERLLDWVKNENLLNKNQVARGLLELKQVKPYL